ncbi:MAG TPA: hypothetical protein VFV48_04015 [Pseudomonadales bacterium]|nr:hypothetical protein [Pseudomonadales bacterium]
MERPKADMRLVLNKNLFNVALTVLMLLVLIVLVGWAYAPGLTGGFVFDDEVNLRPLGQFGGVKDSNTLLAFLSSGVLPGRPLSLLSFLIDGNDWPLDTYSLKVTGLKIHLLAALLVFWLTYLCVGLPGSKLSLSSSQAVLFAGLLSLLWSLNPFQVSTVSYIIQRMTSLSALFVLAGLICFVKGRTVLPNRIGLGLGLTTGAIVFWGLCAILAKENGVLIAVFALLFDFILFDKTKLTAQQRVVWRWWKGIFLWTPLILLLCYLLYHYRFFTTGYERRDFTVQERLLTQPRILWLYLKGIFFSSLNDTGLFSFKGPLSEGLFKPLGTLWSLLALIAVLIGAVKIRRVLPLVSLGLLFFFSGHLIESTAIPLELYFEHRNYLPQFGLWLAFCSLLVVLVQRLLKIKALLAVFAVVLVLLYGGISYMRSAVWGDDFLMAKLWHQSNPTSVRTALLFASSLAKQGDIEEAKQVLNKSIDANPNAVSVRLSKALIDCRMEGKGFDAATYISLAKTAPMETAAQEAMAMFIEMLEEKQPCVGLTTEALELLALNYIQNPYYYDHGKVVSYLYVMLSELSFINRNLDGVIHYRDLACEHLCTPRIRYEQAVFLLTAGLQQEALAYLDKADQARSRLADIRDPLIGKQIQALRDSVSSN